MSHTRIALVLFALLVSLAGCSSSGRQWRAEKTSLSPATAGTQPHVTPIATEKQVWTKEAVPLHATRSAGSQVTRVLPPGTILQVSSSEGPWYFVTVGDAKGGWGWVEAHRVTVDRGAEKPTSSTAGSSYGSSSSVGGSGSAGKSIVERPCPSPFGCEPPPPGCVDCPPRPKPDPTTILKDAQEWEKRQQMLKQLQEVMPDRDRPGKPGPGGLPGGLGGPVRVPGGLGGPGGWPGGLGGPGGFGR